MNNIRNIMQFWWETYRLVSSAAFEETTFQAHLAVGRDLFKGVLSHQLVTKTSPGPHGGPIAPSACQDMVRHIQSRFQADLNWEFRLTTGLSMELLWLRFRPTLISKNQTLQTLINLEALATRFDSLRWRVPISVSEQSSVVSSFVKAHQTILTCEADGWALIEAMSSELDVLEGSALSDRGETTPFFSRQFETLRQYQALRDVQSVTPELIVLANYPTVSLMHLRTATKTSQPLQVVSHLWGQAERILPLEDTISASLLSRLNTVGDVNLGSLRLLETELPILGRHLANESASLCQTQVPKINLLLSQLIEGIIEAHNYGISEYMKEWTERLSKKGNFSTIHLKDIFIEMGMGDVNSDIPHHVQEVMQGHLMPALVAIAAARAQPDSQLKFSSLAWIHFAVGCIVLYVPDRPFDPDKRQRLKSQQHQRMKQRLEDKLTALRQFEVMFTGQNANLRCLHVEEELRELGEPVEAMQVFRPDISELDRLQGEFNNLLSTILSLKPHETVLAYLISDSEEAAQRIRLLQSNLVQIIRRLSERFRSYSDITVPLVGILRCLQVGLFMADTVATENPSYKSIKALSQGVPFFGDGPTQDELSLLDYPLEALASITVASLVEGIFTFSAGRRRLLFDIFHSHYNEWSKQLDADRKEAESKTSLYRFRGSADDEKENDQEEFNELFPAYNDDSSHSTSVFVSSYSARDTAIVLANAHADIFLGGVGAAESTLCLIRRVSKRIGNLHSDARITKSLLPGVIVMFNDLLEASHSTSNAADSFNFYTDANLREARKLVGLIHQIQNRFQELQKVDEISHMQPLADVIVSCTELLKLRYTEPLAKVITKVEKIHGFMHEWQFGGWASRANSVISLYNDLTSTIISWRRLELATWSNLFDMETKRCGDDAKSWWFIAYEVVVAVPLSIAESESQLRDYARKLLHELEAYFASSIQGQFIQRLRLIKQLQKHLELLALDMPLMTIILAAVSNFTDIYTRYEIPVQESIRKGRQVLEKAMRDVLLLASWKDTNIAALRDSARRSHYKLFKLVRKYRALLGQPMEIILKQGLPDIAEDTSGVKLNIRISAPIVDKSALALCERGVHNWSQKSKRFLHASRTIGLMDNSAIIPESTLQAADYLESFLSNIITSTAELRKATPSSLTEGNKDMLTHLKLRKRKLFADTLKEIRQMGINYNLGTSALEQQNSLSAIISVSKQINLVDLFQFDGINCYYYKTLDLIPQARAALRQHSQDLTRAEVVRSVGFLEGLLRVTIKQRNTLASYTANSIKLQQVITKSEALWNPSVYCIQLSTTTSTRSTTTRWLPNILKTGLNLVKMHDRLGDKESTDVQRMLLSWIEIFESFVKSWESLPDLPKGIKSTYHGELEGQINNAILSLRQDLTNAGKQWSNLEFILLQIIPWTVIRSEPITRVPQNDSIAILDQKISKICDSILVAVENLAKSIASLPNSTEDPSWLIKTDNCLGGNFGSNYGKEIISQIDEAFEILASLDIDDNDTGKTAGALFAVALPIFQQYWNIFLKYVERYAQLHHSTCKLTYILTKVFTTIASDGFCTPSEKADAEGGKTDKLEDGTGLGEGEGTEDISKDIQDDEDLSELGQEQNKSDNKEIEDEKDAVDMADGDLEGEMGDTDVRGEGSESGDEAGDEMDEEAGDVDDLDPNAVDEKMWDGEAEKAEKNQETDKPKGKANEDKQTAAQENQRQVEDSQGDIDGEDGKDEEEEPGAEQGEEVNQRGIEKHDPLAQEGETLELPEEMELDGPEQGGSVSGSDDEMDGLSDLNSGIEDREDQENVCGESDIDGEDNRDEGPDLDVATADTDEDKEGPKTEETGKREGEENQNIDNQEGLLRDQTDDAMADLDNSIPNNTEGIGEDKDTAEAEDETPSKSAAKRGGGGKSGDSSEQTEAAAEDGELSRQADSEAPLDRDDNTQENNEALPFKKLGDVLEKWYRQQTEIREATEQKENERDQPMDVGGNVSEFKHLQDEEAEADAQAIGTATEDQARDLDESMAVNTESKDLPEMFQPDEDEDKADGNHMDIETPQIHEPNNDYEGRAGAMMRAANTDHAPDVRDIGVEESTELDRNFHEVDNQLSSTSIEDATLPTTFSATQSRQLWAHYESITRGLSFALTEQLRLILAPTVATKMRGDFRTGKRLNIKRIIPYIASQYKRDKIWMRRSVPSKRSYQILLAVDDSKSMAHSGSGLLAFETLVMVSRSLSMLEVGQICVVGFGENVKVAHEFEMPFSADSGPKIFQSIGFQQNQTNITKLVRESIEIFRTARARASGNPTDLWQLELIISDGVCNSSEHEPIRRLLREAIEERIMVVFVVVDDLTKKKKGESVMDLKEAKFVKDETSGASSVRIERYLDTFPFQYYLIVSDVKELPGVLAALLRQWFAEVAESG
jgi:midasin